MTTRNAFRPALTAALLLLIVSITALRAQAPVPFIDANEGIDRARVGTIVRAANGDLLAGTPSGLYRMPAGTERWEKGTLNGEIHIVERLPSGALLAGTSSGIRRSSDNGATWASVFGIPGVGDFGFNAKGEVVAIDRQASSISGEFFYFSDDEGRTWESKRSAFTMKPRSRIVALGDFFFAGSTSGVKISYNGGELWESTRLLDTVAAMAVTTDGVLVAAGWSLELPYRIYESHDTGRTWAAVDSGFGTDELVAAPDGSYYAVAMRAFDDTTDDPASIVHRRPGQSGRSVYYRGEGITHFGIEGEDRYLAIDHTVLRASSEGNWTELDRGLRGVGIERIAARRDGVYALVPHDIYPYHTSYQLFRTTTAGESWEPVADRFGGSVLEADRFGNLYAARDTLNWRRIANGLFMRNDPTVEAIVSNDGGMEWRTLRDGHPLHIADDESGTIAMSLLNRTRSSGMVDLALSHDSGRTWTLLADPGMPWESGGIAPYAIEIAADGSILMASQRYDSMTSAWTPYLARYIPATMATEIAADNLGVRDLLAMPDGSLLAITTTDGIDIVRSIDDGETWALVGDDMPADTLVDAGRGVVFGRTAYYSADSGASWFLSDAMRQVATGTDGVLYGFDGTRFKRSFARGSLWIGAQFTSLPPLPTRFVADSTGHFFIGSQQSGIWRTASPTSSVAVAARVDALEMSVAMIDGMIEVRHHVAGPTPVALEIHDLLGRRLALHQERAAAAGPRTMRVATGELAAGAYLLVVRTDEGSSVRTIVVR